MRTSIATVCLSGGLVDKLTAAAAAGFDGVEVFEPDLVAANESPEEIRALAGRLGLSLDLYQPFRDAEGVSEELMAGNLRRAESKFALMNRLGVEVMLVCSNVGTATIDSDEVSADQLRRLGDLAATYGVRLAYEALAWGTYVSDYRRAWRIVRAADHPAVGVCLDSFHILSRGHDPAAIEDIPADKIFFLQLADAPALSMDVLSWSRHHRLFPGEGAWDLGAFVGHVVAAGYTGPLSLEVFNDTFRQTDPVRTAAHARRSLAWVADQAARWGDDRRPAPSAPTAAALPRLPDAAPPTGVDFVEIKAEDTGGFEELLGQVGFGFRGRHRTKPVTLWSAGDARVVLNEQRARDEPPHLAAIGFTVPAAGAALGRAYELGAEPVHRRTYATETDLRAVRSPDGTEIFLDEPLSAAHGDWVAEFEHGEPPSDSLIIGVDHVNLVQPWQDFDEAILFYTSVLGLTTTPSTEVAGPRGLVRSQVMRTPDGCVRLPLNVAPPVLDESGLPQHIAFSCTDVATVVRRAREQGLAPLRVPANYYDDLAARFALEPDRLAELRELDLLYDRDQRGEFVHFYTATIGEVFLEFVERRDGYDGYGAQNAPIRLAAQAHRR